MSETTYGLNKDHPTGKAMLAEAAEWEAAKLEAGGTQTPEALLECIRGVLEHAPPGETERDIASRGLAWLDLLLRKNRDYGGSTIFSSPRFLSCISASDNILARMSDKVARIEQLAKHGSPSSDEPLEDSIADLGGYCLLWLIARVREKRDGG